MATTTYNYSIADDTPNGKVAPRNLDNEIVTDPSITVQLSGVTISGDDLNIEFQAALTTAEETELDAVVAAHVGDVTIKAPLKLTAKGVPVMQPQWKEGNPTDFISFNWCDKTTWYSASTRVTNEVLTEDSATAFRSVNVDWICVTCGRITQEHRLVDAHAAVLTVDDVAVVENSVGETDNDYTIDYATGIVTFNTSQTGKSVKATYSYATTADYYIEPAAATTIRLTAVEIQMSEDIDITTSVRFDIEGFIHSFVPGAGVDDVSPNYTTTFPTGFRVPLGSPRIYKTMMDFVAEAQRAYPAIPALGGASWRGLSEPLYVMRWPYSEDATRDLVADKGMRIKISLGGDISLGGTHAIATFYAVSTNDAG